MGEGKNLSPARLTKASRIASSRSGTALQKGLDADPGLEPTRSAVAAAQEKEKRMTMVKKNMAGKQKKLVVEKEELDIVLAAKIHFGVCCSGSAALELLLLTVC